VRHRLGGPARQRCQSGGGLTIEFALIFPALVGLLILIIDAGSFIGARVMLSHAVSSGVRTAALSTSTNDAAVVAAVQAAAPMLTGLSVTTPIGCVRPDLVTPCTMATKGVGDRLTVTATNTFDPIFFNVLAKTLTQSSWTVVEW
jgi:Flp pilus assembly protein TadG